jgi:hypothetical protein
VLDRETPASDAELTQAVAKLNRESHPPILPAKYEDYEFGDERHYIRQIAALAKEKGVPVAFLALPYYSGPATLQDQHFYEQFGPVWNARFAASHEEWFADYAHMTGSGAKQVTDWLIEPVSTMLKADCRRGQPSCP